VTVAQSRLSLATLRREAAGCTRCELYRQGTQTVFGEGPADADLVLVGEQPGDREDRSGQPFVGPAGRILEDALEEAGLRREDVYLTNAVKHFRNEPRGKKRIHRKPDLSHVRACEPWLDGELAAIRPRLIVALGATATRALLGPGVQVRRDRGGRFPREEGADVVVTVHPSSILRLRGPEERAAELTALAADLAGARRALEP